MNKKKIIIILSILAVITLIFNVIVYVKDRKLYPPIEYGVIQGYFDHMPGGWNSTITYPLFLNYIRCDDNDNIIFSKDNDNYKGFYIVMNVTRTSNEDAEDFKSVLLNLGHSSKGLKNTKNGYVGEIISNDSDDRIAWQNHLCNLSYMYFIPLADTKSEIMLKINIAPPIGQTCILLNRQNYTYFKHMIDHIIDNFYPAF